MAGVTLVTGRDSHIRHGDARGRDTLRPPKGGLGGVTTALADIADRLERLAPSHRDPFRFHEDKSELIAGLREAVATLDAVAGPSQPLGTRGVRAPEFGSLRNFPKGGRTGG